MSAISLYCKMLFPYSYHWFLSQCTYLQAEVGDQSREERTILSRVCSEAGQHAVFFCQADLSQILIFLFVEFPLEKKLLSAKKILERYTQLSHTSGRWTSKFLRGCMDLSFPNELYNRQNAEADACKGPWSTPYGVRTPCLSSLA